MALCIRDHLTHVDGWNIPEAWIDDASIIAFTGLCAQFLPLRDGGQERRYRVGGYYTLDEECKLTSQRLLATCDGQIHMTPEGKIGLMGGEWTEPDVTLGEDDIIEIELEDGRDPFTEYNVQKGIYIDPENDFTDTEVREWRDTAALATQPERVTEFEVDMCPSGPQLQRLMKIRRMRDRREWVGTIRTKLSGIKARFPKGRGAHIIRVVWPELDIDGPFEVTSWGLDPDRMECIIGIGSVENAWAWDAETEEKLPPKKVSQLPTPDRSFAIPTGLVVQQQVFVINYGPDLPDMFTTKGVQLVAFVDDPGRAALRPAFEYREQGAGNAWFPMSVTPGTYRGISDAVSDNTTYEVRARFAGQGGVGIFAPWGPIVEITTLSTPVAPDPPTGFSRTVTGLNVKLTWTNTTSAARVFRSTTNSFSGATSIRTVAGLAGQESTITDETTAGTWYYWVVALNPSAVASTPAGPLSATTA